jgi:single-stranded-DNA-specific exonuclease
MEAAHSPQPKRDALAEASLATKAATLPRGRWHLPQIQRGELPSVEPLKSEEIHPVIGRILTLRGIDKDTLPEFMAPSLTGVLAGPRPKGMQEAAELLATEIRRRRPIGIACDYDVDGTSSAAILAHTIERLGGKVVLCTPNRFSEGYGLNSRIVKDVERHGCKVVVSLDFGTSNEPELAMAKELGIKSIVVDHHQLTQPAPPSASVFVNPNRPDCKFAENRLCTAGLAYLLATDLRAEFLKGANKRMARKAEKMQVHDLLGLTALGTICDLMPLTHENRALVGAGLRYLSDSTLPGVRALLNLAGLPAEVHSDDVGFKLGPRINAASRMTGTAGLGDIGAHTVLELFMAKDEDFGTASAQALNRSNIERKKVEEQMTALALEKIGTKPVPSGIVVWDPKFHEGVNGIVAARLVERFHRPSAVLSLSRGGNFSGSVRGIEGIDVLAALKENERFLEKYGGHAAAAGLTVKSRSLAAFVRGFDDSIERQLNGATPVPRVKAELELDLSELKSPESVSKFIDNLDTLEPFGKGNPMPKFLVSGAQIVSRVLQNESHIKLMIRQGNAYAQVMAWRLSNHPLLENGQMVDLVVQPLLDRHPIYDPQRSRLRFQLLAAEPAL